MNDDAVILDFLEVLADDRRQGRVHPLSRYQARYSGFEQAIATAYAKAHVEGSAGGTHPDARPALNHAGAEQFGAFRIIGELGCGGQGVVYLAEDVRVGRRVALKVLSFLGLASNEVRTRFRREAAIASRLSHPNICTVYEADTDNGVPYIAMEVVDGVSLARLLSAERGQAANGRRHHWALDLRTTNAETTGTSRSGSRRSHTKHELSSVLHLIEKTARALHFAHESGIVHRDVKPGNIMVTRDGEPVLTDFGLARMEDAEQSVLTLTGDVLGTPAYMSPEQLTLGGGHADRRSDVYALGVTLYECLTLARPFEAPTREALHQAILTQDPVDPRRLNPAIPAELKIVLDHALEKDRDRRYQTAQDLAEELRRVRCHEPILARRIGPLGRLTRWARRNPVVAAALTVTMLLLSAIVLITWWKNREIGLKNVELRTRGDDLSAALVRVSDESARTKLERERVARLKDRRTLRLLLEREQLLWPPAPDMIPAMETWLADAAALLDNLPLHREALTDLEERAGPYSESVSRQEHPQTWAALDAARKRREGIENALGPSGLERQRGQAQRALSLVTQEIRDLENRVSRRIPWSAVDEDAWIFEVLSELVPDLEAFGGPGGPMAAVRDRIVRSEAVRRHTIVDHAQGWTQVSDRVASHPRYDELVLPPQLGLIPLGPDPDSGLEEFLHWLTHHPSHRIPERRLDGRLPPMDDRTGVILVLIPGGTFLMGSSPYKDDPNFSNPSHRNEHPVHEVALAPFFLGKHELTRGQWVRISGRGDPTYFTNANSPLKAGDYGRHPATSMSWVLGEAELRRAGLAMPTEARWEYACRAGSRYSFFFKDFRLFPLYANLADRSYERDYGAAQPALRKFDDGHSVTAPVGSFVANAFGLHDMHGNVAEWCQDLFGPYSAGHRPGDGLLREAASNDERIIRGGCIDNTEDTARAAQRSNNIQTVFRSVFGLRAARDLDP